MVYMDRGQCKVSGLGGTGRGFLRAESWCIPACRAQNRMLSKCTQGPGLTLKNANLQGGGSKASRHGELLSPSFSTTQSCRDTEPSLAVPQLLKPEEDTEIGAQV
jgi:hypothetical protein